MLNPPDARYLPLEVQQYLRQRAILLREQGETFEAIAAFLGVHRDTVSRWWHHYQQQGDSALTQEQRGRKPGDGSTLSAAQAQELQQLLTEYYPDELGIDSALWTRRAVQALIQQQCGIDMPIRTIGDYLKRWGFTPQKPTQRASKQEFEAVAAWLLEEYPLIEQLAAEQGAEIHWGDEAGLKVNDHRGRGYAPVGQTPEVVLSGLRVRINYLATINAQGTVRFNLYQGRFTAEVLLAFLERLVAGAERKVFLILDNHPVHWAMAVQQWLDEHQEELEVFYLPRYSPELNPAEYLNSDVKQAVHSQPPTRSLEELKQRLGSHLHKLQKLPGRVMKYFKHDVIAYADSPALRSLLSPG